MKFLWLLFFICFSASPARAAKDSFEDGTAAFAVGNYEEAERIMRKYEKDQPGAAYIVKMSRLLKKTQKEEIVSYDNTLADLFRGDRSRFEKLGIITRFNEEISGISGAMYVNNLRSAAARGHTPSIFRLGLLHQEGIGLPGNYAAAVSYFEKAAQNGHAEALNTLGLYYRFGIGVKKNPKTAENYYRQAVLKNYPYAFYNLAQMYADQGNFLDAFILSDLGMKRINRDKEKKTYLRTEEIRKQSEKKLSSLQTAYLKKFLPFWLSPVLTQADLNGRKTPEQLPEPPEKMISETPFMTAIKKDAFENRYKTFFPLMPDWVFFNPESPKNPALEGKKTPAPVPGSKEATAALYFREADGRNISLTLDRAESAVPLMVGDIVTLYVYTPLYEDRTTQKGGHMYLKNTAYKIEGRYANGVISTNHAVTLTPLSPETDRREAWLSQSFMIKKDGVSTIRFVPRKTPDGTEAFAHTLKIVAFKGIPPK